MANVATAVDARTKPMTAEERKVIIASSLGTVFEWYDFYLYGTLAAIIGKQFFSQFPPATQAIFALLTFAAGFLVRPFGALVFGRLGDLVGRKYTFLLTILIMGLSTFAVGLLPSYDQIGVAAPIILVALRMAQGLALGGEYGGAVVYVAEHSPRNRRGFYTAWIQTTATMGLLLSLFVIVTLRLNMGEEAFATSQPILFGLQGGWRIPFLLSIILLIISIYIRLQMNESPLFKKMKEEGTQSKAPLSEAFGNWGNGKIVLIALFGLVVGQAVVWYTGQFYALFFLQTVLKIDLLTANVLIAWALIIATPFFLVFGSLSDRIGRKPVILAGCLLAAVTYFPLFSALTTAANPTYSKAIEAVKAEVRADPATCGSLFDPVGIRTFTTPCDVMRRTMSTQAFRYTLVDAPAGSPAQLVVNGGTPISFTDAPAFNAALGPAMVAAGYPAANDPGKVKVSGFFSALANGQSLTVIAILTIMVIYVTIVYGPIAAALVEFFPTRIRYTAMSLPYHIGNGWFGGLLPATSFAIVASTGDIFAGLWYPVIFALLTVVIGVLFVREKRDVDLAH
ncbi:MFS transporter [Neorhizobium sp. T25_27]|uniref:MFS transporter n=1 Tax=Neorhizobium sp. T25_27 TaxID=2093831 RepID=UPI000CF9E31F|nr:MFS transporter [Neorhizobium sp. T25_27]